MSETDFLKLKKHDNVETNTEKFDIENYLNGNWDKINKNAKEVNTKISNINSNNTELEKELKEIQEDFYQNSIRGQARGEYIHVEDSSNCRAKIGIGGNSEQETRSGKNKLEFINGTYTDKNVTAVVKDGVITLNGNPSSTSFVVIDEDFNYTFKANQRYTISLNNSNIINSDEAKFRFSNGITIIKDINFNSANKKETFYFTEDTLASNITIRTGTAITYNNFVIKPQLELEETASEWEQGGASPSPDYPSEVECCGDNINLFDKNDITNNTSIDVRNGNTYKDNNSFSTNFIKINGITELCCNGLSDTSKLWGAIYDENKSYIKGINTTNGIFNETNLSGATYIRLGLLKTYLDTMKLEKGSTPSPYSKYGQGCVKVTKCNKNLVNVGENSYSTMGLNITLDKSRIKINGTPTSNNYIFKKDDINAIYLGKFKKGTYYMTRQQFSGFTKKGNGFSVQIRKDVWNGTAVANYGMETTLQQKKVILDEDVDLYLTMWANKDDIYNNVEFLFSIYSDIDINHVQHQEQSYIMPTQREMLEGDFFDFDNEEEVHTWNKLILNGTESWTYNSIENLFYIILENSDLSVSSNIHCTHFKSVLYNVVSNENNCITANGIMLMLKKNDISNLEDYISYLKSQYDAGTPVTIYYKLATPTRLPFTDEQKAVAKELNNARTYKNVTNITTDSKAILSLDYAKDLETLLNNTQALAVNNASEGV